MDLIKLGAWTLYENMGYSKKFKSNLVKFYYKKNENNGFQHRKI